MRAREQEIEVWSSCEEETDEQEPTVATAVAEAAAPPDSDAGEGMANWARHQNPDHRRFCHAGASEAKVSIFVTR